MVPAGPFPGSQLTAPCCSSLDALPGFAPVKLICHFPAQALSLEDLPPFISIGLTYHHPGLSKAVCRVADVTGKSSSRLFAKVSQGTVSRAPHWGPGG